MKSICIKTNNSHIIDYILEDLKNSDLSDVYVSNLSFKIYKNVIIHYTGTNLDSFLSRISAILTNAIIIFYENIIISNILDRDFFYFNSKEKETIKSLALSFNISNISDYYYNYNCIFNALNNYLSENKSLILNGFVSFRIKPYITSLENLVSCCVNDFIINREHQELIDILKIYISSKSVLNKEFEEIHLVYINNRKAILLDHLKNNIPITSQSTSMNFISDISFSDSTDCVFNTLIELAPNLLHIHLANSEIDDFINTLMLIFDGRFNLCENCSICEIYKLVSYDIDF